MYTNSCILIHIFIPVYSFTCTHSYAHLRILIHILIYVYSFTFTHSYTNFTYTHSRILIHILIHIFNHVLFSYTHSRIFIHKLIYVYSFTYTHSHTHSYTYSRILIHVYSFTYSIVCSFHIFLSLNESILLRNWNQSNRIIQNKVMAFSCQLVNLPITLGTVCITHFSEILTSCLTLYLCTLLKLRC